MNIFDIAPIIAFFVAFAISTGVVVCYGSFTKRRSEDHIVRHYDWPSGTGDVKGDISIEAIHKREDIKVTLLDIKTGRIVKSFGWSLYSWTDGNASCDCNRAIEVGEDISSEMEEKFGNGNCFGCTRIIAIDVDVGCPTGMGMREELLNEINDGYSERLRNIAISCMPS